MDKPCRRCRRKSCKDHCTEWNKWFCQYWAALRKKCLKERNAMRRYPHCEECGGEINPNKYEDCERYYLSNGRVLCRECFLSEAEEYLERNTEDFARAVGAAIVEV